MPSLEKRLKLLNLNEKDHITGIFLAKSHFRS